MKKLRRSAERGAGKQGWLDSRYTFSFADYYDPSHMGFRSLRVINEDWIAPSMGFGSHSHRDMEILTYPIEGALEHRDSEGNTSILRPGRVQLMRAGTGIVHSEINPLDDQTSHLLQIWIEPDAGGLAPLYQEADIELEPGRAAPVASKGGLMGGLDIHQDVTITATQLGPGGEIIQPLSAARHLWMHVVKGSGTAGDLELEAGDGLAVSLETELVLKSDAGIEVLTFDLA